MEESVLNQGGVGSAEAQLLATHRSFLGGPIAAKRNFKAWGIRAQGFGFRVPKDINPCPSSIPSQNPNPQHLSFPPLPPRVVTLKNTLGSKTPKP